MTSLLLDPDIGNLFSECTSIFESEKNNQEFCRSSINMIDEVDEWRYSSSSLFDLLPFRDQTEGFNPGKIIKINNLSFTEAISKKSVYATGFKNGQPLIIFDPIGIGKNTVTCYDYASNLDLITKILMYTKPEYKNLQLRSYAKFRKINNKTAIRVGVSESSYTCYKQIFDSNGRLVYELAFSKGWPTNEETFFHYGNDGELEMITTPSRLPDTHVKVWPKSKNWNVNLSEIHFDLSQYR